LCGKKIWHIFVPPSGKAYFPIKRQAGAVAQLVEHRTENPGVGSSILPRTTSIKNSFRQAESYFFAYLLTFQANKKK
jgi:hypothetical protein